MSNKVKAEHLNLEEGVSYTASVSRQQEIKPPIQLAIGKEGYNKFKIKGFDPTPSYQKMSRSAHWVYWKLIQQRNVQTNIAVLRNKSITDYERKKLTKAYRELRGLNLLVRIKQETYMFNPKAIIPVEGYYLSAWDRWTVYVDEP